MKGGPSRSGTDALDDHDGPKIYRDGTHRIVDPETTLARAKPFLAAAGVTRVAMLTGLDVIGIPVAAAYRPNSRSISVHQGKGISVAAAKASAVMEAIETFHAESIDHALRLGTYDEIRRHARAADPLMLPRPAFGAALDTRILWDEGRDLISGEPVWVPQEMVGIDLSAAGLPGGGVFQATTNGLASGNHWLEAVTHAIYEAVERDAVALWRERPPAAQDKLAVDLDTVEAAAARSLLAQLARSGMQVRVWDVTSDIGLPVFACLLAPAEETDGVQPDLGFGCHADREIALCRALTEAAQARLTVISGARDDLPETGYGHANVLGLQAAARSWMTAPARRDWRLAPNCAGETLADDLQLTLARLGAAGLAEVIHVDLTRPEIGIPVARIVIPGLEGPWAGPGGAYVPGKRARAVASAQA
jgi:ribosomal protein S12 methylthiotransferase accessory factor